jgi:hypothetical protein
VSHRTPTKTDFSDEWREDAACRAAVTEEPSLSTAWDNIDEGTWEEDYFVSDPQAHVAKNICFACPVRKLCIEDALFDNEAEGIRGGFRFEKGYVSKEDARKMYKEFGLRAKVRKVASKPYVKTNEV